MTLPSQSLSPPVLDDPKMWGLEPVRRRNDGSGDVAVAAVDGGGDVAAVIASADVGVGDDGREWGCNGIDA